MALCIPSPTPTPPVAGTHVRVMRWTYRCDDESVVCELALNDDLSAYELRISPPWNSTGVSSELFNDAIAAFQRHSSIERTLVADGWSLESFESGRVVR